MLTQQGNQESLKTVGYYFAQKTVLNYQGQPTTITGVDILQRHVWLANGVQITFDQAAALSEYEEIRYS